MLGTLTRSRGFSLLEVMIALVVLSVGLLGILKLEASAVSSTNIAAKRSIAALEAASLAATMHVNRGYWANSDPSGAQITVQGTAVTVNTFAPALAVAVAAGVPCNVPATPCPPTAMAAYDLKQWATVMQLMFVNSNYAAVINCGAVAPVSCTVNITWGENSVAINAQQATEETNQQAANTRSAFEKPSYTLYVEP